MMIITHDLIAVERRSSRRGLAVANCRCILRGNLRVTTGLPSLVERGWKNLRFYWVS